MRPNDVYEQLVHSVAEELAPGDAQLQIFRSRKEIF
jgi:hypothetical protein